MVCSVGDGGGGSQEAETGEGEEQTGTPAAQSPGGSPDEPSPHLQASGFPSNGAAGGSGSLFERLRAELRSTFVSFLLSSLPSSLIKKYGGVEVVEAMQSLALELRRLVGVHNLPTDIAEDAPLGPLFETMQERHGSMEWISFVLKGDAAGLCDQQIGGIDIEELIDLLQGMSQDWHDRLSDEIGPLPLWAVPPSSLAEPPSRPEPDANGGAVGAEAGDLGLASPFTGAGIGMDPSPGLLVPAAVASSVPLPSWEQGPAQGPWDATLAPAPWEEPVSPVIPGGYVSKPPATGNLRSLDQGRSRMHQVGASILGS